METIINSLFVESDFKKIDLDFGSLFLRNKDKRSYWIVVDKSQINKLDNVQADFFEDAKAVVESEWFDKNVYLLILWEVDSFSKKIIEEIQRIEENPYLFKKQVLLFKKEEAKNLNEQIGKLSELEFIKENLLKNSVFEKHKENLDNNEWESLLFRIVTKLPFINLIPKETRNLESLTNKNYDRIQRMKMSDLNMYLEEEMFFENIENLSPTEIYEKLKFSIDEGSEN